MIHTIPYHLQPLYCCYMKTYNVVRKRLSLHEQMLLFPNKFAFTCEFCQWCQDARTPWPGGLIIGDCPNEGAQLCHVGWWRHPENCLNFLFPWFDTLWCYPMAKEIHLMNSSLTLKWVDFHVVVFQMLQYLTHQ
eukprot:13864619-Ditylum_brightwellii.AAC.1